MPTHAYSILLVSFLLLISARSRLTALDWISPPADSAITNPITDGPNERKEGQTLYSQYCASCHGASGKGDGVGGIYLIPKSTNFTDPSLWSQTDGSLFYKLSTGRNAMPPFKTNLSEAQRWKIIRYLRTFSPKPPAAAANAAPSKP